MYMNGVQVEEANSFEYLGATLSKDGSSMVDMCIRIATATVISGLL